MAAYYHSFNICKINSAGFRVALPGEIINVQNITTASSLGTLQSDNDANFASATFAASAGDIVEFSSGSYPNTFRQVLGATQAEAYENPDNKVLTFVVEDLSTAAASQKADLYLIDLDNPSVLPKLLDTVKVGSNEIPYQTAVTKNLRLRLISKDDTNQLSTSELAAAPSFDISVPALGGGGSAQPTLLFENYSDVATATTSLETLYLDIVDAGTFINDGDLLELTYHGTTANNGNTKVITFEFNGSVLVTATTTAALKGWELNVSLMRSNKGGDLRYGIEFTVTGVTPIMAADRLTGLDLENIDYDVALRATTATAAGDVTAIEGDAQLWRSDGGLILIDEVSLAYLTDEVSGATLTDEG